MDKTMRGYIESAIDELIEETQIIPSIDWVQQEIPISSFRDVVTGYAIGTLETMAVACIRIRTGKLSEEEKTTIRGMLKRRLPEIMQKIERELGK